MASHYERLDSLRDGEKPPVLPSNATTHSTDGRHGRWPCIFKSFPKCAPQLLSLAWLAPAIAVLTLNITNHQIGASAWCPFSRCDIDPWTEDPLWLAQKYDKQDHNLIGALQFVSKALELWFGFIAANLVYNITMVLSASENGLPLGLLGTFLEFKDFAFLVAPFQWSSPNEFSHKRATAPSARSRIFCFLAFAGFLCLITNLMGPATAVLAIPTLNWVDAQKHTDQHFISLGVSKPPTTKINLNPSVGSSICDESQLAAGNYSCTYDQYGASLDNWLDSVVSSDHQAAYNIPSVWHGISYQGELSFMFNISPANDKSHFTQGWAPNRQALQDLTRDVYDFYDHLEFPDTALGSNSTKNFTSTVRSPSQHTKALKSVLTREGPILGAMTNFYTPQHNKTISVGRSNNQYVRCFDGWSTSGLNITNINADDLTRCIRMGVGLNSTNVNETFYIEGDSLTKYVEVCAYFSDQGLYVPSDSIALKNCLVKGADCEWEDLVRMKTSNLDLDSISKNLLVIELSTPDEQKAIFEFVTSSTFATYTLDTSLSSNPLYLVHTEGINTESSSSLVVHPDWLLAAWSIDKKSEIPFSRSVSSAVVRGLRDAGNNTSNALMEMKLFVIQSYFQALSMVNYDFYDESEIRQGNASNISTRSLSRYRQNYVWKFGLHSRTAKLGIVVVSVGVVVVLLQVTLSLIWPPHQRSFTELLAAAMSYQHRGELSETNEGEEKHAGKIPYRMGPRDDGSFKFEPMAHWNDGFVEKSERVKISQISSSVMRVMKKAVPF
ncbi:MAG: hypothetical protein LQ351_007676 [Letrouitia transgressa]|nr:MAG: hypothetical protein LQ351_007676 [Letrouitia transgressa]